MVRRENNILNKSLLRQKLNNVPEKNMVLSFPI